MQHMSQSVGASVGDQMQDTERESGGNARHSLLFRVRKLVRRMKQKRARSMIHSACAITTFSQEWSH